MHSAAKTSPSFLLIELCVVYPPHDVSPHWALYRSATLGAEVLRFCVLSVRMSRRPSVPSGKYGTSQTQYSTGKIYRQPTVYIVIQR